MLTAAVWVLAFTMPTSADRQDIKPTAMRWIRLIESAGRVIAAILLTIYINRG